MVAIITGRGAGIENSSVSLLGSRGALGNAQFGRFGDSVYVNAANGNLVVTGTDEMLVGRGPDAIISRTYNSLGAWDGDNNDQWRAGVYRRVFGLTGAYEAPGSTIKRTDWDGSEQVYQWDDTKKIYWSTDGAGSYDTLKRLGTVWTWTDGQTQVTETYDDTNSGRVTSRSDASGNTISYSYNGALLQRVTTSAGEYTELVYTDGKLTSLVTNAGGQVTRTTYGYDNNRLNQVTVVLDASRVYTTTYTYDGNSNRIASITQGDGSRLTIEYDVNLKVKAVTQSVADGEARRTGFVYEPATVVGGVTEYRTYITDAAGQTTTLTHDASGNLLKVTSPPVGESGTPQVMQFTYEADGDVATVSTGPGNVVTYSYDANGNVTRERDSAGNTVDRGYSADRNLLLWERRYVGTSSTSAAPSDPFQTSYVYDAYGRIRFTVSPEGRVTETRYDGFGQQSSQIIYTGSKFPVAPPSDPATTPSLSELESWVSGTAVRSEAERTDNWYDFRGNVIRSVRYATLNGYGEGGQNPATVIAGSNSTVSITPQANGIYKVTKTSGGTSWTSDAHSTVRADGDYVLQVKPNQNNKALVAGVSATPGVGPHPNTIGHGFYFDFGRVYYYETGSTPATAVIASSYAANDNFWLVRSGNTVTYLKGADLASATVLRTTTASTVSTVYFDSSLDAVGSSMEIGFTPREFVAGANVSVTELADGMTHLTRTTGANAWNADVFGSIAATGDFALKVRPSQTNKYIAVGVSSNREGDNQLALLQGFYFWANGTLTSTASGSYPAFDTPTTYEAGGTLWLVRQGSTLRYYKGATLEQALKTSPLREVGNVTGTLYFHADFYDQNGSVDVSFETGPVASTEISRVDYVYDASGRLLSRAIAGQGIETFAYDGLGRITAATDMGGTVRNISFDDASNKTKVTLASGLVQVSAYNRAGEMTAFYEYSGQPAANTLLGTTVYGYDGLGRLTRHTDAGGVSQFYRYDALGRKTLMVDGDGSVTQYRYDANGNLASTTRYDDQVDAGMLASLKGDPLVFANAANTTVSLDSLTGLYRVKKTGGTNVTWDAAGREPTPVTGDFVMQIRPGQSNTGSAAGVSTSSSSTGIAGLSLGLIFDQNGVSYLFNGQNLGSLGVSGHITYGANDSFWMVRTGSTVAFYKGETLASAIASGPALRTITNAAGTVYGYVPILHANAHVDVSLTPRFSSAVLPASIIAGNQTSVSSQGDLTRVRKTGGTTGNWLADARSPTAAHGDFVLQIRPGKSNTVLAVGVSATPDGAGIGSIARGLYFEGNTVVYKVTDGSISGIPTPANTHTTYVAGDTFWMERVGGTIRYYKGVTLEAARAAGQLAPDTIFDGTVYLDTKIHDFDAFVDIAFTPQSTGPLGVEANAAKDRTDWNIYDSAQRLIRSIDATGAVTAFEYDGMSRLVRTTQYANRLASSAPRSSLPAASPDHDRVTRNFYDKDGLLVGTLDAEGYLSEIAYDAGGRKVRASRYARQADAGLRALSDFQSLLGNVQTDATKDKDVHHWWLYDARGLLRAEIDGERTLTRYTYSAAGHLTQQVTGQKISADIVAVPPKLATLPAAGTSDILSTVSWTRNLRGAALTETRALTGSTVTTTSYSYDAMGRLLSSTTQSGGLAPRTYGQVWDKQGRLIRELSPEGVARLAALGPNASQGDINAVHAQWTTAYAYDAAGRLISKVEPGGAKTVYYYRDDGALALEVNARGEVTEYDYTAFGERKSVKSYYGPTLLSSGRASVANLVGGLLSSTALSGGSLAGAGALVSEVRTDYDQGGRASKITSPMAGETLYEYNAFGEAKLKVEALDTRSIATEFEFDRRGLLKQQLVDKTGISISTSYGYDAFGRPRLLTNPLGQQSVTEFDREGRVTSVQDAAGNITQYRYDARGNQIATTDALGNVTRHVYDKANRRIATIDPIGVLTSTSYDADGRAVMTRIHGATVSIPLATLEIPENNSVLLAALASAVNLDEVVRLTYNRNGQVEYTIDALHRVTEHLYDVRGNEVRTIAYDGSIAAPSGPYTSTHVSGEIARLELAARPGTSFTRVVYDANDRLVYSIDQLGSVTWSVFDARGLLVKQVALSTRYETYGTPTFAEIETWRTGLPGSAGDKDRITRAFYDAAGRLAYSVDPLGLVTQMAYDKAGNVSLQTVHPTDSRSALIGDGTTLDEMNGRYGTSTNEMRVTSFAYDTAGRLKETVDPLGSVTRLGLDKLGRITASTQAFGTPLEATTHYTYDSRGNVVAIKDAVGNLTRHVYDAANRRIGSLNALGALTRTSYDAAGQVIAVREHATKLDIAASTLEIPATSLTVTSSDADRVTRYAYTRSGQVRFSVDGLNHVVEYRYDSAGNRTSVIAYDGAIAADSSGNFPADHVASQITSRNLASAPGTRVARAVYDAFNRVAYSIDALGQVTWNSYDRSGALSRQVTIAARYTPIGQPSLAAMDAWRVNPANASEHDRITYSYYDTFGQRVYDVDSLNFVTRTGYDKAGKVTSTIRYAHAWYFNVETATTASFDGEYYSKPFDARLTTYNYDSAGNLKETIDPMGGVTAQTYDKLGRVRSMVVASGTTDTVETTFDYDSLGRVVKKVAAKGSDVEATTWYYYDLSGNQVASVDAERYLTTWTYDGMGNRLSETRHANRVDAGVSETTLVDALKTQAGAASQAVTNLVEYDVLGRVKRSIDARGTVSTTDYNVLDDVRSTTVEMSPAQGGNRVTTFGYDAFGNLTRTTDARGFSTYTYYDKLDRAELQVDAARFVTATTYTRSGQVKDVTRAGLALLGDVSVDENTRPFATDVLGNKAITRFFYDKLDRLTDTQDAAGYFERYTLNGFGERKTYQSKLHSSQLDTTIFYEYDDLGRLTKETFPVSTLKKDTQSWEQIPVVNRYSYDALGRLREKIEADQAEASRTTSYSYDKLGRLRSTSGTAFQAYDRNLVGTSVTPTTTYTYDRLGNVLQTVDPAGAITYGWYDGFGRKTAEFRQVDFDALGLPRGSYSTFEYDASGNLAKSIAYEKLVSLPAARTAPGIDQPDRHRETRYSYNGLNQLESTTIVGARTGEWNGSEYVVTEAGSPGGNLTTVLTYDAAGNVIRETDPRGNSVWRWYDGLGNVIGQVDKEGYATRWKRDTEGNVLTEIRYNGRRSTDENTLKTASYDELFPESGLYIYGDRITHFTYDLMGRRTSEARQNVAFTYLDSNNKAWDIDPTSGVESRIDYSYNGLGLVTEKKQAIISAVLDNVRDTTEYRYDVLGRLVQETGAELKDHNNSKVRPRTSYSYDGLNNLVDVRVMAGEQANDATDRVTRYAYYAGGSLKSVHDAEGNGRSYQYDAAGRTILEQYNRTKSDGTSVIEGLVKFYDLAGRVVVETQARKIDNFWLYASELQGTPNYEATHYQYDGFGNLTGRGISISTVAPTRYQENFSYDLGGRLWSTNTGDGVRRFYAYDKAGNQTLTIAAAGADLSGLNEANYLNWLASGDDKTFTYAVFDRRGQATSTIEANRRLNDQTTAFITRGTQYNAFGEVLSETDGRGNITSYGYNAMGRMTHKTFAATNVTADNGARSTTATMETYGYDLAGRLVSVRDANSHFSGDDYRTTRRLLSGTGYDGTEALTVAEYHPDGGVVQTRYDVFGDAREMVNEMGANELREYDRLGRLTRQLHASRPAGSPGNPSQQATRLIDEYRYDELGQRIRRWNSVHGVEWQERTDYDSKGRVVMFQAIGGDTTRYQYLWAGEIETAGMAVGDNRWGGWDKLTTNSSNFVMNEKADYFGRLVFKSNFGAEKFDYAYDSGGRMVSQTAQSSGAVITNSWYNSGLLRSVVNGAAVSSYEYDAAGNRTRERHVVGGYVRQNSTAEWDGLNRMSHFSDTGVDGGAPVDLFIEYDAVGNVRRRFASYRKFTDSGAVDMNGQALNQDNWYRYDRMNRFEVTQGMLVKYNDDGTIARAADNSLIIGDAARGVTGAVVDRYSRGVELTYNKAGQRTSAASTIGGSQPREQKEYYYYTGDGYLDTTRIVLGATRYDGAGQPYVRPEQTSSTGVVRAQYKYDLLGRLSDYKEYTAAGQINPDSTYNLAYSRSSTYNVKNQVTNDSVLTFNSDGNFRADSTYYYNANVSNGFYVGSKTGSTYMGGAVTWTDTKNWKNGIDSDAPDTNTQNAYRPDDAPRLIVSRHDSSTSSSDPMLTYQSQFEFDSFGNMTAGQVFGGKARRVEFVNNAQGQVLQRVETPGSSQGYPNAPRPKEQHFYFDGVRMADVSNNGTSNIDYAASITVHQTKPGTGYFRNGAATGTPFADFDQSYDPINGLTYDSAPSSYAVQAGDTLSSIALRLWGDASFWYVIAEANGLSGSDPLATGRILSIPNKILNSHNSADTFRPYNPNEAIGDISPTSPKPQKKNSCGTFGIIMMLVIAVAVTIASSGAAAAAFSGKALGAGISAVLGATGGSISGAALVAGAAIGGAVGSIASQGFGIAIGVQDRIDWKGVAISGISSAVSAGLGQVGPFAKGASDAGKVAEAASKATKLSTMMKNFAMGSLRGAASNAITQGIARATGLRDNFDFAAVAYAGLGGGVGDAVGGLFGKAGNDWQAAGQAAVTGMAAGIANSAVRSLADGTSFGDNLIAVLPEVIAYTIGRLLAGRLATVGKLPVSDQAVNLLEGTPYYAPELLSGDSRVLSDSSVTNHRGEYTAAFPAGESVSVDYESAAENEIVVVGSRGRTGASGASSAAMELTHSLKVAAREASRQTDAGASAPKASQSTPPAGIADTLSNDLKKNPFRRLPLPHGFYITTMKGEASVSSEGQLITKGDDLSVLTIRAPKGMNLGFRTVAHEGQIYWQFQHMDTGYTIASFVPTYENGEHLFINNPEVPELLAAYTDIKIEPLRAAENQGWRSYIFSPIAATRNIGQQWMKQDFENPGSVDNRIYAGAIADAAAQKRLMERLETFDTIVSIVAAPMFLLAGGPLETSAANVGAHFVRSSVARRAILNGAVGRAQLAAENVASRVTVFRVEGAPNAHFMIDEIGNVALAPGNKTVWLNFGQEGRALSYLDRKVADGLPDAHLKTFEVDQLFLDEIRATAVPENIARRNPSAPIISRDPFPDQYGLRPDHLQQMMGYVYQGSGKYVRPR